MKSLALVGVVAVVPMACMQHTDGGPGGGAQPDAALTNCETTTDNLTPGSVTSPTAPFTASFTFGCDGWKGEVGLDFGDGSAVTASAVGCPGAAACTIEHTYTQVGVFGTTLTMPVGGTNGYGQTFPLNELIGGSTLAIGDSGQAPTLTSLTPASGPFGTTFQIDGSGFIAVGDVLAIDGETGFSSPPAFGFAGTITLTSDAVMSTQFPSAYTSAACGFETACAFQPGAHSVVVMNANGTSNALTFTVTSSQP